MIVDSLSYSGCGRDDVLHAVRARQGYPASRPVSPTRHLEERKAAIYENLRDLQFEYRVGKLSDADYQQTKLRCRKNWPVVLAEIDKIGASRRPGRKTAAKPAAAQRRKRLPSPSRTHPLCDMSALRREISRTP